MIPGMNPKDLAKAMKKMGIKQDEVPANEVIIKCPDKEIIVRNPQVMRVQAMGQDSLQITGEIVEQPLTEEGISDEDVTTVASQAKVSEEKAREALEATKGDLAEAIISLQ